MKIVTGKLEKPDRTLLYGTQGVGKTTYASRAKRPLIFCAEEGSNEIDVPRAFKDDGSPPTEYADAQATVQFLTDQPHDIETFAIDTADALHAMIERHVCRIGGKESIEDFGFGKGHVIAAEEWRRFLASLERMQSKRAIDVLFLVHAQIRKFNPPDSDPYDRYDLKMPEKSAAVLREWAGNMYLAQVAVNVAKGDARQGTKTKAYSDGTRVLCTREAAAFVAKNRIGLPDDLPFDETTYDQIQKFRKLCLNAETELDKLLIGHAEPAKVKKWFSAQADKSAALEALRKKMAAKGQEEAKQ